MKKNIALKLAYDGSDFFGWQKTTLGPSIEGTLQTRLEQIVQEPLVLQAASRTDRGVHAEGQWVNFFTTKPLLLDELRKSLNALLPPAIRILSIHEVPLLFHPTLHAQKKEYHYTVSYGPTQMPHQRFFSWHVPQQLNLQTMQLASLHFLGEHDFASFCNFRKNLNYQNTIRCIEELEIVSLQETHLTFAVTGNQFLYKMVRNIVGTLIDVGRGRILLEALPAILRARRRSEAGVTAPPQGLTLKKIYYPQQFNLNV